VWSAARQLVLCYLEISTYLGMYLRTWYYQCVMVLTCGIDSHLFLVRAHLISILDLSSPRNVRFQFTKFRSAVGRT